MKLVFFTICLICFFSCQNNCEAPCKKLNDFQNKINAAIKSGVTFESDACELLEYKKKILIKVWKLKQEMKKNNCHCLVKGSVVIYGSASKQKSKAFDEYCKSVPEGNTGLIDTKLLNEALAPIDLSKKIPAPDD